LWAVTVIFMRFLLNAVKSDAAKKGWQKANGPGCRCSPGRAATETSRATVQRGGEPGGAARAPMTFEGKFIDDTARAARRGAIVRIDALMKAMRLFESG
jgi:hypothetical protein